MLKGLVTPTLVLLISVSKAFAGLHVVITKNNQTMRVFLDSKPIATWKVSTARVGYITPTGDYTPKGMQKMHFSKKYHNSPMPYSIFFRGGYAIHGTYATGALGHTASHGCVRLAPNNAKTLYGWVQSHPTTITIKKE